jgi:hypothetical protein
MEKEHLEMILEDINGKFDLILEGHESLISEIRDLSRKTDERFDLVDFKIDTLNRKIDGVDERLSKKIDGVDERLSKKIDGVEASLGEKIDGVAGELKAHRQDTEAHRGMYGVRED